MTIAGVDVHIDRDAVVVRAASALTTLSVTEAKTMALAEAGVRTREGDLATGTSSDAVVVAATGRGEQHQFGGPVSELGWAAARATRRALTAGIDRWLGEHS